MPSGIPQHAASRAKNTARNASNTALPQAPFCCLCHPSRISSLSCRCQPCSFEACGAVHVLPW